MNHKNIDIHMEERQYYLKCGLRDYAEAKNETFAKTGHIKSIEDIYKKMLNNPEYREVDKEAIRAEYRKLQNEIETRKEFYSGLKYKLIGKYPMAIAEVKTAKDINTLLDDDYWNEAAKYVRKRLDSKEGQEKLKAFMDFQTKHVELMKSYCKEYHKKNSELRTYILGGLDDESDIFSDGFDDLRHEEGRELLWKLKN